LPVTLCDGNLGNFGVLAFIVHYWIDVQVVGKAVDGSSRALKAARLAMVQIAALVSVGFMVVLTLTADVLVRSHRTDESR
jgi:hypothetical protein